MNLTYLLQSYHLLHVHCYIFKLVVTSQYEALVVSMVDQAEKAEEKASTHEVKEPVADTPKMETAGWWWYKAILTYIVPALTINVLITL